MVSKKWYGKTSGRLFVCHDLGYSPPGGVACPGSACTCALRSLQCSVLPKLCPLQTIRSWARRVTLLLASHKLCPLCSRCTLCYSTTSCSRYDVQPLARQLLFWSHHRELMRTSGACWLRVKLNLSCPGFASVRADTDTDLLSLERQTLAATA